MGQTGPVFIAWTSRSGRATEMAAALGGSALCVFPPSLGSRKLVPLRYLVSAVRTWRALSIARPTAAFVTHPPVVAAAVVCLWAMWARVPFVLDSHPTAFGAKGNTLSKITLPAHRFMARRAAAVMVASDPWAELVNAWGGRGVVVHEAPAIEPEKAPNDTGFQVAFPGIFGSDEPIREVLDAARSLDDVQFTIFGDTSRAPAGVVESAPQNVRFTGWLDSDAYVRELAKANVVLALTTEPTSVMRAACEAVFMKRPVIVSDSEQLREAFRYAIFVMNTADSIAGGIRDARTQLTELNEATSAARNEMLDRWDHQLDQLKNALA